MRKFVEFVIGLFALVISVFVMQSNQTFSPSIAALMPSEALVMKYSACHSGCDKGTIKFKENRASLRHHSLDLTDDEMRDLDRQFLSYQDIDEDYFCSLRIKISFKKSKALRFPAWKKAQLYPCDFRSIENTITPAGLVYHFNETPNETPSWRLPPEEQTLIIED